MERRVTLANHAKKRISERGVTQQDAFKGTQKSEATKKGGAVVDTREQLAYWIL